MIYPDTDFFLFILLVFNLFLLPIVTASAHTPLIFSHGHLTSFYLSHVIRLHPCLESARLFLASGLLLCIFFSLEQKVKKAFPPPLPINSFRPQFNINLLERLFLPCPHAGMILSLSGRAPFPLPHLTHTLQLHTYVLFVNICFLHWSVNYTGTMAVPGFIHYSIFTA